MADMHVHIHLDYAPVKPAQVEEEQEEASSVQLPGESAQDAEYRLMLKYSDKSQTLTPEEFDWLQRRGCVRY